MKLRCIILGCCLFLVTVAASAQEIRHDCWHSHGLRLEPLVPAVKIKVSNPAKGFTRTYASNSAGEYTAAGLPLGDYTVTAEASWVCDTRSHRYHARHGSDAACGSPP